MNKKDLAEKLKQNKAITLIALVITIVVLLILAGVAISAISGNENVMSKANQAKQEKDAADELDTIKLAVIEAMAQGIDGKVGLANLQTALRNIPSVVSEEDVVALSGNGPWKVRCQNNVYTITEQGSVEVDELGIAKNPSTYGNTVNYSTSINGIPLTNWKKLYENDKYTYIILSDYLPTTAIDTSKFTGISISGTYNVYASSTRKQLLDAMNSSYWDELKTGTINGKTINAVSATACPTYDLFIASWNAKYPTDLLYKSKRTGMGDVIGWGYYVADVENVGTNTTIVMSGKDGYSNTLYFPTKNNIDNCIGYWLASPSAFMDIGMIIIPCSGYVGFTDQKCNTYAFRPVLCIPTSAL